MTLKGGGGVILEILKIQGGFQTPRFYKTIFSTLFLLIICYINLIEIN